MTTYKELYQRQAELQRIGKLQGHRVYQPYELDLALLDEIGEVTHELKPLWAWWKKKESAANVNTDKLIDELADVVHFLLIRDLKEHYIPPKDYDLPFMTHIVEDELAEYLESEEGEPYPAMQAWFELSTSQTFGAALDTQDFIRYLIPILEGFNLTAADLVKAYFAKTQVNLDRWAEVNAAGL